MHQLWGGQKDATKGMVLWQMIPNDFGRGQQNTNQDPTTDNWMVHTNENYTKYKDKKLYILNILH